MFDFTLITELLRNEPGHGLVQSFLLAMIWLSSRGIKSELKILGIAIADLKETHEKRFNNLEGRVTTLEQPKKQGA